MIYKHGDYTHPANQVSISSLTQSTNYNDFGLAESKTRTLTLDGTLIAGTQAAITAAISTLEEKYYEQAADSSGLYHDDGTTASAHVLDAEDSIGGIRLVSLDYPAGDNAEYATQRSFRIVLETEVPLSEDGETGGSDLTNVQFSESLSFTGGGARIIAGETISGPPIIQQVAAKTAQTIVQSGTSTANGGYPTIPGPLFDYEVGSLRQVTFTSPKRVGSSLREYGASWSYTFLLDAVTPGKPNHPLQ